MRTNIFVLELVLSRANAKSSEVDEKNKDWSLNMTT